MAAAAPCPKELRAPVRLNGVRVAHAYARASRRLGNGRILIVAIATVARAAGASGGCRMSPSIGGIEAAGAINN